LVSLYDSDDDSGILEALDTIARKPQRDKARGAALHEAVRIAIV
jgi:hypothetical protein